MIVEVEGEVHERVMEYTELVLRLLISHHKILCMCLSVHTTHMHTERVESRKRREKRRGWEGRAEERRGRP